MVFLGDLWEKALLPSVMCSYTPQTGVHLAILSLDQEKAFDRVDLGFMHAAPSKMGFQCSFLRGGGGSVFFILMFRVLSLLMTVDGKMDLHQICTAQIWCKNMFAPEQTRSKRRKCHIWYHIYTGVQIWQQIWHLPRLLQVCSGANIFLHHICAVQI